MTLRYMVVVWLGSHSFSHFPRSKQTKQIYGNRELFKKKKGSVLDTVDTVIVIQCASSHNYTIC